MIEHLNCLVGLKQEDRDRLKVNETSYDSN